jgi:hypothetical protein
MNGHGGSPLRLPLVVVYLLLLSTSRVTPASAAIDIRNRTQHSHDEPNQPNVPNQHVDDHRTDHDGGAHSYANHETEYPAACPTSTRIMAMTGIPSNDNCRTHPTSTRTQATNAITAATNTRSSSTGSRFRMKDQPSPRERLKLPPQADVMMILFEQEQKQQQRLRLRNHQIAHIVGTTSLVVAVASSAILLVFGVGVGAGVAFTSITAATTSASSSSYVSLLPSPMIGPFHHRMGLVKFISSVIAFLPWISYPDKALKQTIGTVLVEFMTLLELVVSWVYSWSSGRRISATTIATETITRIHSSVTTIVVVLLSWVGPMVQRFLLWEAWRHLWMRIEESILLLSTSSFGIQLNIPSLGVSFSFPSSSSVSSAQQQQQKDDSDEECKDNTLRTRSVRSPPTTTWFEQSMQFIHGTLRRGIRKWVQKTVEKTVEDHFFHSGGSSSLSSPWWFPSNAATSEAIPLVPV